jgi:hypothetical protein
MTSFVPASVGELVDPSPEVLEFLESVAEKPDIYDEREITNEDSYLYHEILLVLYTLLNTPDFFNRENLQHHFFNVYKIISNPFARQNCTNVLDAQLLELGMDPLTIMDNAYKIFEGTYGPDNYREKQFITEEKIQFVKGLADQELEEIKKKKTQEEKKEEIPKPRSRKIKLPKILGTVKAKNELRVVMDTPYQQKEFCTREPNTTTIRLADKFKMWLAKNAYFINYWNEKELDIGKFDYEYVTYIVKDKVIKYGDEFHIPTEDYFVKDTSKFFIKVLKCFQNSIDIFGMFIKKSQISEELGSGIVRLDHKETYYLMGNKNLPYCFTYDECYFMNNLSKFRQSGLPILKSNKDMILDHIYEVCSKNHVDLNPRYIVPIEVGNKNLVFDTKTGKIRPNDPKTEFFSDTFPYQPRAELLEDDSIVEKLLTKYNEETKEWYFPDDYIDDDLSKLVYDICGTPDRFEYFMRFVGAALIGNPVMHQKILYLFNQSANNGKSTLMDILQEVFGKTFMFACKQCDVFFGADSNAADSMRYHTRNCRLLTCEEAFNKFTPETENYIKLCTGKEFQGRKLREESVVFPNKFSVICASNKQLRITEEGNAALVKRFIQFKLYKVFKSEKKVQELSDSNPNVQKQISGIENDIMENKDNTRLFFTRLLAYSHRVYKLIKVDRDADALVSPVVQEEAEQYNEEILDIYEKGIYAFVYDNVKSITVVPPGEKLDGIKIERVRQKKFTQMNIVYSEYTDYCSTPATKHKYTTRNDFYEQIKKYEFDMYRTRHDFKCYDSKGNVIFKHDFMTMAKVNESKPFKILQDNISVPNSNGKWYNKLFGLLEL